MQFFEPKFNIGQDVFYLEGNLAIPCKVLGLYTGQHEGDVYYILAPRDGQGTVEVREERVWA